MTATPEPAVSPAPDTDDVSVLLAAAEHARRALPPLLGETAARWLTAEADCHASVDEVGQAGVDLMDTLAGDPSDTSSFRVVVSTLPSAVAFARQVLALPVVVAPGVEPLAAYVQSWLNAYTDDDLPALVSDIAPKLAASLDEDVLAGLRADLDRARAERDEALETFAHLRAQRDRFGELASACVSGARPIPDDAAEQVLHLVRMGFTRGGQLDAVRELIDGWRGGSPTDALADLGSTPTTGPAPDLAQLLWGLALTDERFVSEFGTGPSEARDALHEVMRQANVLAATGPAPAAADLVREFHEAFGLPINDTTRTSNKLRAELIREEAREAAEAIEQGDALQWAKELADLAIVTYGAALTFGIDLDAAVRLVHDSNMSKLGDDGRPVMRADGKVLKGPGYCPPDMSAALSAAPQAPAGPTEAMASCGYHTEAEAEWSIRHELCAPDSREDTAPPDDRITLDDLTGPECGKTGRTSDVGCDGTCAACTPDDYGDNLTAGFLRPSTPTEEV